MNERGDGKKERAQQLAVKTAANVLFFLSPSPSAPRNERGKRSQTLFGNSDERNLERYSISQRLRRKTCGEIVFEESPRASGWLEPEVGERPRWG